MKKKVRPAAAVASKLARVKETPIAPVWLVQMALGSPQFCAPGAVSARKLEVAIGQLEAEARAATALRQALTQLPPAWSKQDGELL